MLSVFFRVTIMLSLNDMEQFKSSVFDITKLS